LDKPSNLLLKLSRQLFADPVEQENFLNALTCPQSFHPCILWCQSKPDETPFQVEPPLNWQPEFVDRLALTEKPGQHSLHHEGFFYCLDFSSVFAASVLLHIKEPIDLIFDMCAAPGGKSIFAWRSFQPKLLLSNEVIGKRIAALASNFKRCKISPAALLSLDSKVLADLIPNTAQIVLVDAPCSGQSLIAKGGKAPGCFHPVNINKNANRQKRILANSAQLVAPQGYLVYMTCTYSPEENEQVIEWLLAKFPHFQPISVPHLSSFQSYLTEMPCYRMFPQNGLGAGAFTALLQNTQSGKTQPLPETLLSHPKVQHF
jgi:16S rRNA C967 or C1407 C5-methylase (RsmB/RsmF family)